MLCKFKFADIIIILIAASFAFAAFFFVYMKEQDKVEVLIRGQSGEWTFPLDAQETVIVSGALGDTIVRLHDNRAWVESSPCNNQTCVAMGFVSKQGQWAACLPNNVLLIIHGVNNDEIDSLAW